MRLDENVVAISKVEFFSGVEHKLPYVRRLLIKAVSKGVRVAVIGDAKELRQLDADLWTAEERDFVPHVCLLGRETASPRMQRTPVWLVSDVDLALGCNVLVNLGPDPAPLSAPVDRLLDVVCRDAADRDAGRRRWRAYEASGMPIEHHPLDRKVETGAVAGAGA